MEKTTIKLSELKAVTEKLFSYLQESGYDTVEISADYYWDISKEERYNPYKEPKNLNLGQVTDDIAELQSILADKKEPVGYALVWLASILRTIGEEVIT